MTNEETFECPACGTENECKDENSFECSSCKCYFEVELNNHIRFIKSGLSFSLINFGLGVFYSLFILGLGYFFLENKMSLLELGFGYLAVSVLFMFRILFSQMGSDNETDSALNIVFSIFNRKIKYFDFGSRLLAYSWFLMGFLGFFIILTGFMAI